MNWVRGGWVSALLCVGCAEGDDASGKRPDIGPDAVLLEVSTEAATDAPVDGASEAGVDASSDTGSADTGSVDTGSLDTGSTDTGSTDTGTDTGSDAGTPWRKTITIDGTNDFSATDETFATTSTGYSAHVTWDASALFVGVTGPDIGSGATASKWVFVYLDTDPGAGTGATKTEQYKDQAATFGTGFGAEAYFAWRTDGTFSQLKKYAAGAWTTVDSTTVTVARAGSFVEMRIPYAALGGTPAKLGVFTTMLNEGVGGAGQWTYAGLYAGSFTDGYYAAPSTAPTKYWLLADLAASTAPSSMLLRKP